MDTVLRVHPEQIRGQIQRLRAWGEAWRAQAEASRRVALALAEAVQAVPGQRGGAALEALHRGLARRAEEAEQLARTLERALERLEIAFREAAELIRAETPGGFRLPTVPLAVGPDGRSMASQFEVSIPATRIQADWLQMIDRSGIPEERKAQLKAEIQAMAEQGIPIPYNLACGWVALSMALSHQLGRPIPAQEVVNRALEVAPGFRDRVLRNLTEDLIAGRPVKADGWAGMRKAEAEYVTTGFVDLAPVARSYGLELEKFKTPTGEHPDELWDRLNQRMQRGETVIALVNANPSNWGESPIRNEIPGTGLRFSDERKEAELPPGGRLRPWDSGGVSHWVVLNRLEEHQGERFVVINNPLNNRTERYRWQDFLKAVDGQVRVKVVNGQVQANPSWWFLSVHQKTGEE